MLAAAALAASLAAFTPVVVHDADERYPLASAGAHAPVARTSDARPAVYGRAVPSRRGGTWLQYWLFYAGQDQDRGVLRTGRHEDDWELVQYRVDDGGRPVEAVYAQHHGGERCGWSTVETRAGHPVVYPAHGSHASYFRAGTRDRMWPDPNDEADGRGPAITPVLVPVTADHPAVDDLPGPLGPREGALVGPRREGLPARPRVPARRPLDRSGRVRRRRPGPARRTATTSTPATPRSEASPSPPPPSRPPSCSCSAAATAARAPRPRPKRPPR